MAAIGTEERDGKSVVVYRRLYCKCWRCSYCGPRKASDLCRRIGAKAKDHDLNRFLTLTLDPRKLSSSEDSVKHLRATWRKFRVYVQRKYGENLSFISVVENHKSGVAHMHVLVDRYLPQAWISSAWSRLGGGRIVHIEHVADLDKMGWYLGKYLTKEAILGVKGGVRRYSTSRDIKLVEKDEPSGYTRMDVPMDALRLSAEGVLLEEDIDSNGHVRSFVMAEPIDKLAPPKQSEASDRERETRELLHWWENQRNSHWNYKGS